MRRGPDSSREHVIPYAQARTLDEALATAKRIRTIRGEDKRLGPREKKVTLPHVSILDKEGESG